MNLSRLLNRYTYISIIKKYPKGLGNRLQHFDEWVKSWNDPHVKTIYEYYYNEEVKVHQVILPNSDAAKHDLAQAASRFRPDLFQVHQKITIDEEYYADDNVVQVDINQMKLSKFVKECFGKQTRTPTHKYFMVSIAATILFLLGGYNAIFRTDFSQPIVQLQPAEQFYHYDINGVQKDVKNYIKKINFLNKHSNDVLNEARQRAMKRIQK